jgi:hypothetical protein
MKRSLHYLLLLLITVALLPVKTFCQQVNDKKVDDAVRQKAYKLLESLAEQIGSLQSGENRARMGSNIAMSLWPHNEARAREMLATVTKEIKAGLQRDDEDPLRYLARPNFIKLREDTALRIAKFDPEWALRFLEETVPIDIKISDDDERELNLRLAMVFVKEKPNLALKLGRESLEHGVSISQMFLIYDLGKKSRVHASALLQEMVRVAPNQDIRHSMEREQIYFKLARLVEPTLGQDRAFRDLMNYFAELAFQAGCDKKKLPDTDTIAFCYRLGLVVPLMEKVNPTRVAPLKHLARTGGFPYEWEPPLTEYDEVYQHGSIDDLLALIPRYPHFRNFGQGLVINELVESGDFERARKLANEFNWAPAGKQGILKEIDDAQRIVNEDTSAEILKEAEGLRDESETFHHLFRVATQIGTKNPRTTVKLLDRASELLDKLPPQRWKVQYQIGIAVRYCQVKSDRCFTMTEPIIRNMNELVSAATKLNGFDNSYLRNGEWNMTAAGGVGSLLTGLAQNAVYFALSDFDQAVALSSLFERREIRMMAQLRLAQGVLDGPPKKPFFADDEH